MRVTKVPFCLEVILRSGGLIVSWVMDYYIALLACWSLSSGLIRIELAHYLVVDLARLAKSEDWWWDSAVNA